MACEFVELGNGGRAIVCGTGRPRAKCRCGRPATLLCDWKLPTRRSGTCDAPLCPACTAAPAPGKDLCPDHAAEWQRRLAARPVAPPPEPEARP